MLEGLVVWVLNNYLGKYVENLNTDQLSVALLSGKVELENLPLRKDALRHLGLPVEVKAGFIGKVQLQVPVRQIRSAPWVIAIEKLYLVASPVNLDEWDSAVEANIAHERKVAILDALEAQWRAEHEAQDAGYYATSYSSWLSYGTGLLAGIVENLQLKLNDVHIRYEDAISCAPNAFSCGLTVESLSAESCDGSWRRGGPPSSDEERSFKLMELQKLAIYWDSVSVPVGLLANYTLAELAVRMSGSHSLPHVYIVSPSTAVARVRRERCEQPLRSRSRPRLHCALTLDRVDLNLTDRQYSEAAACSRGLSRIARLREMRARRPPTDVVTDPRLWWLYALECHAPHHTWMKSKPTWETCAQRARRLRTYVDICLGLLTNPAAALSPERKADKDDFEWNTPLHLLKPLREIAMRKVPRATPTSTPDTPSGAGRSMLVRWFPQWWGWYGGPAPVGDATGPPPAPPELEGEILDVIADSLENDTLLKRDTVFGQFEFLLNDGCLNLSAADPEDADAESSPRVELQFTDVRLGVESRPRASSHAVTASVGDVCLRDRLTPRTLFPVLVAPQGAIREGLSAMNVASNVMSWCRGRTAAPGPRPAVADPLFRFTYEKKPFGLNCDHELYVKSQSLEVVYNGDAVRWVSEFLSGPWRVPEPAPQPELYASVRDSTKMRLINHWERILHGEPSERSSWRVELDISAPQILLVEQFTERDAAVMLVDFGKMHLANGAQEPTDRQPAADDEEMFMTPCSTPPGSPLSPASPTGALASPTEAPARPVLDHAELHRRLYDTYTIEFSDLQILVGRARDNWKYAHTKTTSSLHLLDRFTISLQAERRVVYTSDPQYPSATLCGTLPALVVHLSEQKLSSVRSVVDRLSVPGPGSERPPPAAEEAPEADGDRSGAPRADRSPHRSTLFMLQFAIDQMSLEVQSRGRSIAEVQVCGVRAAVSQRPDDWCGSLSVHSLLLVDALQTYGPDFELLVASHKHVGMDVASGSIRGSEPTSPTSPASPATRGPAPHPAPSALASALSGLVADDRLDHRRDRGSDGGERWSPTTAWGPPGPGTGWGAPGAEWGAAGTGDSEALIAVELCVVRGEGELRIANILFNNLDIIANQETIVELIGFTQRVLGANSSGKRPAEAEVGRPGPGLTGRAPVEEEAADVRTEITFDFHRLGVLLLRAAVHDGNLVAKKIATATLSEAKIQATLDAARVEVRGSLGGLQVVSLCAGAGLHGRTVSVGREPPAPLAPPPAERLASALAGELYRGLGTASLAEPEKALVFTVERDDSAGERPTVSVRVSVHVASVWYTHSAAVLAELHSCLAEFKQYLANLARSIRAAAADMAMGLVLQQTRSDSVHAGTWRAECSSPRRARTSSLGARLDADCLKSEHVVLSVVVELETPVVVLPRSSLSTQVFVAHLGRMTLANRPGPPADRKYGVRVRDISLYSLDVCRRLRGAGVRSVQSVYSCAEDGKPVLHDTALHLDLEYSDADAHRDTALCEITGEIVGGLRVSATREQYEQLLETVRSMSAEDAGNARGERGGRAEGRGAADEVGGAVPTLRLDPHVRAQTVVPPPEREPAAPAAAARVTFSLPTFTVELRGDFGGGEKSLVDLSFKDFNVSYEKIHPYETSVQVSLHSVTMEDLTQDVDSKHRMLMVSHTPQAPRAVFVSKSCPDLVRFEKDASAEWSKRSLPDELNLLDVDGETEDDGGGATSRSPGGDEGGSSARREEAEELSGDANLVWISVHARDPQHPHFEDKYEKVSRFTKVDFNCLNLVVSIDSWVAVLDFFGVAADDPADGERPGTQDAADAHVAATSVGAEAGVSEVEVWVRSLSVVLVGGRGEVCRAHVSGLALSGGAHSPAGLRGRLGALSLADLTPHAGLWRDRLFTPGRDALAFHYRSPSAAEAARAGYTSSLTIESGGVSYVHTKRFVAELQAYFRDFSLLRRVLHEARRKVSVVAGGSPARRLRLRLRCSSPVIVVPVSSHTRAALLLELATLVADNRFERAGDSGTISSLADLNAPYRELLDVRSVRVERAALWCARRGPGGGVLREGPPLLREPCTVTLQIEHNMDDTHNVPDMTIHGGLEALECSLEPAQYRLLRGVLAHNLGEHTDDPPPPPPVPACHTSAGHVWTLTSIELDLQNVTVNLEPRHGEGSLACINFIKSRLVVETHSDLSQDVDLVSQEILVSDTRYQHEPANRRGNVFRHIVQPMHEQRHAVQAEVHARRRGEHAAYTVLVNSMRLMAVLDWWDRLNWFLIHPPTPAADDDLGARHDRSNPSGKGAPAVASGTGRVELKLNITESQLVLVEDASVWDTNAVILKSTTVLSYRAEDRHKPVSCELNDVEVFSCVLGLEDETALSIVEPAAVHVELDAEGVLHFQTSSLNLRLSYHDMRMFASMLKSLPEQARLALSGKGDQSSSVRTAPANSIYMSANQRRLAAMGFSIRDCAAALQACEDSLDAAALWLTVHAEPPSGPVHSPGPAPRALLPLRAVHVRADCLTLCVIDDCLDSDVPLLELSLTDLHVEQDLRRAEEAFEDPVLVSTPQGPASGGGAARRPGPGGGRLSASLGVDYYNRTLSGWEPMVEPWRFGAVWEYTLSGQLAMRRLQVEVQSGDILSTNLTSALIHLLQLVRTNWTQDYYAPQSGASSEHSPKSSPAGHRRRSPFVPYALRNRTGHKLWFTTFVTMSDELTERRAVCGLDDSWSCVRAGDTEPFSFGGRRARGGGGARHARDQHHVRLHQVALRVDGWHAVGPVCVDRVGNYFRLATHAKTGARARVVLEVSLEGSARKLVTVRSALRLRNRLPHPVEVRVDGAPPSGPWGVSGARTSQVGAGDTWSAPLSDADRPLWVRPLMGAGCAFLYCARPLHYHASRHHDDRPLLHHGACSSPGDELYRFSCVSVRERFPSSAEEGPPLPGHTLTLVPALRLENLLPLELHYRVTDTDRRHRVAGTLSPGDTVPFHQVNVEEGVEVSVRVEGFRWSAPLSVLPTATSSFCARVRLLDQRDRRLYLNTRTHIKRNDGIKVSVSAAYWLVNRTGLPLVYRAEGSAGEAAGQGAEHELARVVAPLVFSFAEAEAGPTVQARLGTGLHAQPDWCSPFGLGPGVTVRRLEVRGGGADRVFAVGVNTRAGRGRYRHTNIVTLCPRYQIHNNTSYKLHVAQKCTATTLSDPGARATHLTTVPGCYSPWHWPRWDRERLLCVRIQDAPCAWSGAFRVDADRSLHVACRERDGAYRFLRVEVASQGATLFVVLTDADSAPPPIRVLNYSPVAVMFHQVGCTEECVVGAHSALDWALPEPEAAAALSLRAPGGPRLTLQLDRLGAHHSLHYQNFIYVAFTATDDSDPMSSAGPDSSPSDALVLEVPLGTTKVLLGKKRYGDRSQLWRRGPGDRLVHEGSSPPQPSDALDAEDGTVSAHALLLDIEGPAPRPGALSALCLRRADPRRVSTQTWRLDPAGRMCCAHANLCLQPEGGLFGLRRGGRVVLGLPDAGGGGRATAGRVPPEQRVAWRRLRPGSGRLRVSVDADGPTRLVTVLDRDAEEKGYVAGAEGAGAAVEGREWGLRVSLRGVGVSLVSRSPSEELAHAVLAALVLDLAVAPHRTTLGLSAHHMQWDNQLLGTPSPVLLYCLPERSGDSSADLPALDASLEITHSPARRYNALFFRHLVVSLRPLAVRLEEKLLLKLYQWAALPDDEHATEEPDETDLETHRMLGELTAVHADRYYFGVIKIIPSQIRLSMCTANKLEPELQALKRRLGLTLIKFEDAAVELEPFLRHHHFDTAGSFARMLLEHFKDQLKWQAAKILGSVDFLGNPLGFVADVSEGVSGLIYEGSVGALLQNLTHGISNSAAKVTESLGDGLERVVVDEAHEETRRRIRSAGGERSHLVAGFRGLGLGLLGGVTSLVKHSYEGAAQEGLPGFLAGVGKGLVGTVTKPVIGVLDLAAETASAVRDTSRRSDRWVPVRVRGPRCAAGPGGLLPRYSQQQSAGAQYLYQINRHDYTEGFLAYRLVRDTPHDIRALFSTHYLRIFTCKHSAPQIVMETHLSNLVSCVAVSAERAHYVELGVRESGAGGSGVRRPRVQCDTDELAGWVARHAAYANQLYHDTQHTVHPHPDL